MVLTVHTVLLVAAIILFLLAAAGVTTRVSLTDVGLACFAGAFLFG